MSWCCYARTRPREHMRLQVLTHECILHKSVMRREPLHRSVLARRDLARERKRASISQARQQALASSPNLSPSPSPSLRMYASALQPLTHDTPHGRRNFTSLPHPCAQVHSRCLRTESKCRRSKWTRTQDCSVSASRHEKRGRRIETR